MNSILHSASVSVVAVVLLAAGCGGPPRVTEVHGTATHAGKPLTNVTLHFADQTGWESSGEADGEGHFTLRIPSKTDALEPRTCKVWFSSRLPAKEDADGNALGKSKKDPVLAGLLKKYGSASATPKSVEIRESDLKVEFE